MSRVCPTAILCEQACVRNHAPECKAVTIGRLQRYAIDKRLGAEEVTIAWRRGSQQMSATPHEQAFARDNGVRILNRVQPSSLLTEDGRVTGINLENNRSTLPEARILLNCPSLPLAVSAAGGMLWNLLSRVLERCRFVPPPC